MCGSWSLQMTQGKKFLVTRIPEDQLDVFRTKKCALRYFSSVIKMRRKKLNRFEFVNPNTFFLSMINGSEYVSLHRASRNSF